MAILADFDLSNERIRDEVIHKLGHRQSQIKRSSELVQDFSRRNYLEREKTKAYVAARARWISAVVEQWSDGEANPDKVNLVIGQAKALVDVLETLLQ
jgi:hypothetical protein